MTYDEVTDRLYGVIVSPVQTLRAVSENKPVLWAIIIYTGVSLLTLLANTIGYAAPKTAAYVIIGLVGSLAAYFAFTGLLHIVSRLLGGKGSYFNLFSAIGFAYFPMIFTLPALLIGFLGAPGAAISGLFVAAVTIWVLVLEVIALREAHLISTLKSIFVYISSLLFIAVVIVIPIIFLIVVSQILI